MTIGLYSLLRSFRHGSSRRRRFLRWSDCERLEDRLAPALVSAASIAGVAPIANDDAIVFRNEQRGYLESGLPFPINPVIDVFANDFDLDGDLNIHSLTVTAGPTHGSVVIIPTFVGDSGPGGPLRGAATAGAVDEGGVISLSLGLESQTVGTPRAEVFVRLGVSDFTDWDENIYDFRFQRQITASGFQRIDIPRQRPGTSFIAWTKQLDPVVDFHGDNRFLILGIQEDLPDRLEYVPQPGFSGKDMIRYTIQDRVGHVSREATITIDVLPLIPSTIGDLVQTAKNTAVIADVLINDIDINKPPNGVPATASVSLVQGPARGAAVIEKSEYGIPVIRYTPNRDFSGTDEFRYTARIGDGPPSEETVVTVIVRDQPPEAKDDQAEISAGTVTAIDVLANDADADGSLNAATISIIEGPRLDTATVQRSFVATDDNSSPISNGKASALAGTVDAAGRMKLVVSGTGDSLFEGIHSQSGDFRLYVRFDQGDFLNFDRDVHDRVFSGRLVPGTTQPFQLTGLLPYRSFIAWIDNQSGSGVPDTILAVEGGPVVQYEPGPLTSSVLIVDEFSDIHDGNFSKGHLSLREAIDLSNGYVDTFQYTVRDDDGLTSYPATVTVTIPPTATTITFDPSWTARTSRTLKIANVSIGDVSQGNSAFQISAPVTIKGPAGPNRLILAGLGPSADLRAFHVTTGGDLTLQNLQLQNWLTDGNGAALLVEQRGKATLTDCRLINNAAGQHGGAISLDVGQLALNRCTLEGNRATENGGAVFVYIGSMTADGSRFSNNRAKEGGGLYLDFAGAELNATKSVLSNNSAEIRGGGLYSRFGEIQFTDSSIEQNKAFNGGGVFNAGMLKLLRTDVSQNTAYYGGGISNGRTGPFISGSTSGGDVSIGNLTLQQSLLDGNQGHMGGGLYNHDAGASFTDSHVANNRAVTGGGVYNQQAGVSFQTSAIFGNSAEDGAGVYIGSRSDGVWLVNLLTTTIANNTARHWGGGVFNSGDADIQACTISGNFAASGGGLLNQFGTTWLKNSLIAGNLRGKAADDIAGATLLQAEDTSNNLIGKGGSGGLRNGVNGNLVGVDPRLAPLGNYGGPVPTMPLLPGSAAIDAGSGTEADARGVAPVRRRDIGAFESRGFQLTIAGGDGQSVLRNRDFLNPLIVIVSARNSVEPVAGGVLQFAAPTRGASASIRPSTSVVQSNGRVQVNARANAVAGAYSVTASTPGAMPVKFYLQNLPRGPASAGGTSLPISPSVETGSTSSPLNRWLGRTIAGLPATDANLNRVPAASTIASEKSGRGGVRYRLTEAKELLRKMPAESWTVLDVGVESFQVSATGDMFALNDRKELIRYSDGNSSYPVGSNVTSFAVSSDGILYLTNTWGQLLTYKHVEYKEILPLPDQELFCEEPPSAAEIMRSAHLTSFDGSIPGDARVASIPRDPDSPFENVRIVVEPVTDHLDSEFVRGVGRVFTHHCGYKCTIYFDARIEGVNEYESVEGVERTSFHAERVSIVFIDYTQRYRATKPVSQRMQALHSTSADANPLLPIAIAESTLVSPRLPGANVMAQSLTTASDGTIYLLGRNDAAGGIFRTGNNGATTELWRLSPGARESWKSMGLVKSFALGANDTAYVVDVHDQLKAIVSPSKPRITLDRVVSDFTATADGSMYWINGDGALRKLAAGARHAATIDHEVETLKATGSGEVYWLNKNGELQRTARGKSSTVVERNVQSFFVDASSNLIVLAHNGALRRLNSQGMWTTIDTNITSIQADANGTIYVLNRDHQLRRLTDQGHGVRIHDDVQSFELAPTAFRNLYLLTTQGVAKRLEAGYSWETLRAGVVALSKDKAGIIEVTSYNGKSWRYGNAWANAPVLDPVEGPDPIFCTDSPTDREIIFAANYSSHDFVYFSFEASGLDYNVKFGDVNSRFINTRIEVEAVKDELEPARYFTDVGPARLHHCHYRCTIYYDRIEVDGDTVRVIDHNLSLVIFIDHDHLIRWPAQLDTDNE